MFVQALAERQHARGMRTREKQIHFGRGTRRKKASLRAERSFTLPVFITSLDFQQNFKSTMAGEEEKQEGGKSSSIVWYISRYGCFGGLMSMSCSKMRLIMTVTFNNPFSSEDPSVLRMRLRAGSLNYSWGLVENNHPLLALMVCKELLLTKPFNTSNKINKLIMGKHGEGSKHNNDVLM